MEKHTGIGIVAEPRGMVRGAEPHRVPQWHSGSRRHIARVRDIVESET